MVSTLHRCSYDNSTISSVKKLKKYGASFLFSLLSLFFYLFFLFILICFVFQVHVKESIYCFSWTLKLIKTAYYFHRERERERERESRRSPIVRAVIGWCDGAR